MLEVYHEPPTRVKLSQQSVTVLPFSINPFAEQLYYPLGPKLVDSL